MDSRRINPPFRELVKEPGKFPGILKVGSRSITISGTDVHINLAAMHIRPVMGRRLSQVESQQVCCNKRYKENALEGEILRPSSQEDSLPWRTGRRIGLGKNLQVELVATLAYVIHVLTAE